MTRKLRIGFVGSRGIPHTYSGNEEFFRHLAPRLAARGHEVTVYCRTGLFKDRSPYWEGVHRVFLPAPESKSAGQFIHATLATVAAVASRQDVVYCHTLPSAPHTVLPWALRRPVVVNMDGLEWERTKWGRIGKTYFKMARDIALHTGRVIVNDSRAIREMYLRDYGRDSVFIPYGSDIETSKDPSVIAGFGLEPHGYYLVASRLVPENSADKVIGAYKRLETTRPLVIAGSANYTDPWIERVRKMADDRVRFIGHVSDPQHVVELHVNCFAYIHGHTVGGTNPSLVKALGCGNCILAYASPFNTEVLTGEDGTPYGLFFKTEDELLERMSELEKDPGLAAAMRERAPRRIAEGYSWPQITDAYEKVFLDAAGA